jgi:hypothetical protein
MTTDIEHELRELFRDKAGDAPIAMPDVGTAPPREVLRRGRIHQIGTAVGSAAIAFAIVAGSVAALGSLLRGDLGVGYGDYELFERTATIEAFTVTSPSDWYLVNHWPRSFSTSVRDDTSCEDNVESTTSGLCFAEAFDPISPQPYGLPMLQLSNVDLGLNTIACQDLRADTSVLYVAFDYDLQPIPNLDLEPFPPGMRGPSDGTCGPGLYSHFTVNGYPMFAWVGVGAEASAEDREIVETAYEMMSAIDGWEPTRPHPDTPAYVVAGGTSNAGSPWRLDLRPSTENVELSLEGAERGGSAANFTVPSVSVESCCEYEAGFSPVAFGAIDKEATGVELILSDGSEPFAGTIVPLPPTMPFDFDLFFIEGTSGLAGEVVGTGLEQPPSEPTPDTEPRGTEVTLSGADFGRTWIVRFTGAFADESACIDVKIEGATYDRPLCLKQLRLSLASDGPSMHSWQTEDLHLLAGAVPTEVEDITFESDGGGSPRSTLICTMGPLAWTDPDRKVCVVTFPPEGSGTLRYVDGNGNVLFEEGLGWGLAPAGMTSEWAVADGTICGERWTLTRVHSEKGFSTRLDLTTGSALSEGFVLGDEALPIHWTPIYGCPDPTNTSAPEWIVWGLVSRRADAAWVLTDEGDVEASLATESGEGPFVFWALLNDGTLQGEINAAPRGEIVAFDDCDVIGRGTFSTSEETPPSPAPRIEVAACEPVP